jgi:hypothetical protein
VHGETAHHSGIDFVLGSYHDPPPHIHPAVLSAKRATMPPPPVGRGAAEGPTDKAAGRLRAHRRAASSCRAAASRRLRAASALRLSTSRRCSAEGGRLCHSAGFIEAPWLVHGRHGASIKHH